MRVVFIGRRFGDRDPDPYAETITDHGGEMVTPDVDGVAETAEACRGADIVVTRGEPHVAGGSDRAEQRCIRLGRAELQRALTGRQLQHVVNPEVFYLDPEDVHAGEW